MDKIINDFIDYLETEKYLKNNTLLSYRRDVKLYKNYIEKNNMNYRIITEADINSYINYLREEGRADSSLSRNIASIKSLYSYLFDEGKVKINPTSNMKYMKSQRKTPSVLTDKEIDRLLKQPKLTSFKGYRDKAMLEVLYATGIKVSELISLKFEDIDLNLGYITCNSSDKPRLIPLHEDAIDALRLYIYNHKEVLFSNSDRYIFINKEGKPLTRQGFWKSIKEYASKAKISKEITPTTLRHSFAAHLLQNGAGLEVIREMMGHADISTTQIYKRFQKNKIAEIYNSTHPKAK